MLMPNAGKEPPLSRLPQTSLTRARMSHCTARLLIVTFSSGKTPYVVQSYGGAKRQDGQTHTLLSAVVRRVIIQSEARV